MSLPVVIDNVNHRLVHVRLALFDQCAGKLLDIATACFSGGPRSSSDRERELLPFPGPP
jgi:hypothetical protein